MSHLGAKPVKGGRPPRDSRIRGVRVARTGPLAHEVARALMWVELEVLNARNAEDVIMI